MKNPELQDILMIAAGGTIAAEPYAATPEYVRVESNIAVVEAMQDFAEGHARLQVADFSLKDSKDISEDDLGRMANLIAQAGQDRVVITHGTDAMPQNARSLKAHLVADYPEVLANKTIVFTGAMEPLAHGRASDARGNLRDALEAVLTKAPKGVRIVMHGAVIRPERAEKDYGAKRIIER